jgi:hypothetical protein
LWISICPGVDGVGRCKVLRVGRGRGIGITLLYEGRIRDMMVVSIASRLGDLSKRSSEQARRFS